MYAGALLRWTINSPRDTWRAHASISSYCCDRARRDDRLHCSIDDNSSIDEYQTGLQKGMDQFL